MKKANSLTLQDLKPMAPFRWLLTADARKYLDELKKELLAAHAPSSSSSTQGVQVSAKAEKALATKETTSKKGGKKGEKKKEKDKTESGISKSTLSLFKKPKK